MSLRAMPARGGQHRAMRLFGEVLGLHDVQPDPLLASGAITTAPL